MIGYPTDFKFKGKPTAQSNLVDAQHGGKLVVPEDQYNDYIKWKQMKDQASLPEASANMAGKCLLDSNNKVS